MRVPESSRDSSQKQPGPPAGGVMGVYPQLTSGPFTVVFVEEEILLRKRAAPELNDK